MKRKIIIGVILLIVVAGIIGYRMYSKKVTSYADEKPEVTIDAIALVQAFEKDTANASKRFIDKIIRVSGMVKSLDSSAVVLGEDGPSDVVVGMDDRNAGDIAKIKVGEKVVLQGKFSGYNKAATDSDDLLASIGGTTVNIDYAGLIKQ